MSKMCSRTIVTRVVLARHRFTREGRPKDYLTAHVYEIRDGKLARCFEQPPIPQSSTMHGAG